MAEDRRSQDRPGAASHRMLEAKLGYRFARPELLKQALTHSSFHHEQQMADHDGAGGGPKTGDNERLEFLGDAIVGMLVAESLFRRFPALREGDLTRMRAALVSRKYLGEVGQSLGLGEWLRIGRSEEKSGGRKKSVLPANCVEALTAAIYLDSGSVETTAAFVERIIIEPQVQALHREIQAKDAIGDYKSALQEYLQARGQGQPEYTVKGESGPDHKKKFLVEVRTTGDDPGGPRALARGTGGTKKKAEQEAAQRAFERLRQNGSAGTVSESP